MRHAITALYSLWCYAAVMKRREGRRRASCTSCERWKRALSAGAGVIPLRRPYKPGVLLLHTGVCCVYSAGAPKATAVLKFLHLRAGSATSTFPSRAPPSAAPPPLALALRAPSLQLRPRRARAFPRLIARARVVRGRFRARRRVRRYCSPSRTLGASATPRRDGGGGAADFF